MAHDVFISHSVKDKTIADAVCAALESEGVRCWIAPRDVMPGMEWGRSIIEAIEQARIMILVFTANSNASSQIRREVERAVNHDVAILPFRVENILPDKSLEYFIGNVHWLDALTPPIEKHIERLVGTVKVLLAQMQAQEAPPGPQPPPPPLEAHQPEEAEAAGLPKPFLMGEAANSEPSERPSTEKFAEWSSGAGATAPARSWRVPVWAWGGAVVLALALGAFFAVRFGMGPAPSGSPPQVAQPAAGEPSGGAPAGQSGGPAAQQPPRTIANPAPPGPPPASSGGGGPTGIEGAWIGALSLPSGSLPFEFDLSAGGGGTVKSPTQRFTGPLQYSFSGSKLTIRVPLVNGIFSGTVSGDQASGTWIQNGSTFPLTLSRPGASAANPEAGNGASGGGGGPAGIEGAWIGALSLPSGSLPFEFDLSAGGGGTAKSPTQNFTGPLQYSFSGSQLTIQVPSVNGAFTGMVIGDQANGVWIQNGNRFPLTLTK